MKKIIWLEDRPETVTKFISFCQAKNFDYEITGSITEFADLLNDSEDISYIFLDIMLMSIKNLEAIDIDDSGTEGGFSAGYVIIDKFLRPKNQTGRFKDIPIIVISTRNLNGDAENMISNFKSRGGGEIYYLEKEPISGNSLKKFKSILM